MDRAMKSTAAGAALLIGAATACGPSAGQEDGASSSDGTASYSERLGQGLAMAETLCATCHAIGATGDSPHADAIPFRQFSWNYPIDDLAEPFAEGIMVGHPDMPEWQFEPNDIDALLTYIESIQEPRDA